MKSTIPAAAEIEGAKITTMPVEVYANALAVKTVKASFGIDAVVKERLCVGCGSCAVVLPAAISMQRNEFGYMSARIEGVSAEQLTAVSKVCPFSDDAVNEDGLAEKYLPTVKDQDTRVGRFISIYAGRVGAGEDVALSSSGGLTSWLTLKLLEAGDIDGVIHVGESESSLGGLFSYCVSTSPEELRAKRKSQYYSTSISDVLTSIRGNGKKYAFVGVPCFVKATRLLMQQDPDLHSQIVFTIGLVCGHLKSSAFAELLAWQVGVPPDDLKRVDFREKMPGRRAHDYHFAAIGSDGVKQSRQTNELVGGNWGHAMFQLKACDYCDDIFAETADVAFGDAWLTRYVKDWRGTNVVVVRNQRVHSLFREAAQSGEITLDDLSVDDAALSQAGNYRHRWDGLALRLHDDRAAGLPIPKKRIIAGSRPVSDQRSKIIRLRRKMAQASHELFRRAREARSLRKFIDDMKPYLEEMQSLTKPTGIERLRRSAGRALRAIGLRV